MQGGKGIDFCDKLLHFLENFGLSPKLIWGQAMDSGSMMLGTHGGLQALIHQVSPCVLYA